MQDTQEIESGEDEEPQGCTLGVVGSVLSGEVGFEAAEPILDVLGFVEGGFVGERHGGAFIMRKVQ